MNSNNKKKIMKMQVRQRQIWDPPKILKPQQTDTPATSPLTHKHTPTLTHTIPHWVCSLGSAETDNGS